jgi:hypothetical protein
MKKIYLIFNFIFIVTYFLIFSGCASTITTTKDTTSIQTHTVNIPVQPIQNAQIIPADSAGTWHETSVTPQGDTIKTTINEVINPKKPKAKPSLHVVQTIIPVPVKFTDTTQVNKTQTTQVIKAANPIMVALGNFVAFVLKFLFWIVFALAVIAGVIYAMRKGFIKALMMWLK